MKPSLSHAYVRVRWAHKQLKELEALCSKETTTVKGKLRYPKIIDKLPKHPTDLFTVPRARMPFLSQVLAGQIVNGLRSALDYLIANLAEIDSGVAKRKTQFPIECCAKGFHGRQSTFLNGLNPAHVAKIERLQPYNGCTWTKHMGILSNLDKHNTLIPAKIDFLYSGMYDPIAGTNARPLRYKVHMYITPAVFVGIGQGEEFEVTETLREIEVGVKETLASFKPDFR